MRKRLQVIGALALLAIGTLAYAGGAITGYDSIAGGGTGSQTGFLVDVVAHTEVAASPYALVAADNGRTLTNEGVAAEGHFGLLAAAAGNSTTWICEDANGLQINAQGGDTIRIEGGVSIAGGQISTATVGAHITLTAINATEYIATGEEADEWLVDDTSIGDNACGEFYVSTPVNTVLTGSTPAKLAGTTTALIQNGFTHTTGRLTYNGLTSRNFLVTVTISGVKGAGGPTLAVLHIAKGGSIETGLNVRRTIATAVDEGSWTVIGTVPLATGEFVEPFVQTTGDDFQANRCIVNVTDAGLQ